MQRLSGVLMVLAGTALGGFLVLPAPHDGADKFAEVAGISSAPDRDIRSSGRVTLEATTVAKTTPTPQAQTSIVPGVMPAETAERTTRVFSPSTPLTPLATERAATTAVAASSANAWTAVVTTEPAVQGKLKSSRPGDAETRAMLAGDLQRELKRVGCYSGDVTGTWTPSTKRAMSAFMERVNATLPVDEPDYILLTLVQGHTANACGTECPAGQVTAGEDRCVPRAVVAQAAKKSQREEDRRAAEERKAQQQERLAQEQRAIDARRLADSRSKSADAARVAAAEPTFTAPKIIHAKPLNTAAAEPEKLPWADQASAIIGSATAAPTRSEPLPGMMSIGGPRQATAELPASVAAVTPDRGPRPVAAEQTIAAVTPSGDQLDDTDAATSAQRPDKRTSHALPTPDGVNPAAGLPGTKSGPAVHRSIVKDPTQKYQSAKIVRRPQPVVVYAPPKQKFYNTYASNSGGKLRRGQPRPGTPHYNLMQSLGGIY